MNYINFSTNFNICLQFSKFYIIIYSYYIAIRNYYNVLFNESTIIKISFLKQLSNNKESDKTLDLLQNSEKNVYDFINDLSDLIYKISQSEININESLFLKFLQDSFKIMYFDLIKHYNNIFEFGQPFFDCKICYKEVQNSVFTIYLELEKEFELKNFLNILIELKLIAVIFTDFKNIILNEQNPKPTPV